MIGGEMLSLKQLIQSQTNRFDDARVKIVRHKDRRPEYRDMLKHRDQLLEYQRYQGRPVFHDCDYILSFLGGERSRSIFFGAYKVNGHCMRDERYYYDLEPVAELAHFDNRVVIDWGGGERSWWQWYDRQTKEIIEILPAGYLGTFPGLLNFTLDYADLQRLMANPEANHDWRHHLSAVNGIYLILDKRSGKQYIGSACGKEGIWQRWGNYAQSGHGDNRELRKLEEQDADCYRHFLYSVLQPLPSNITQREIVQLEGLYKQKLGSRAHGLNAN